VVKTATAPLRPSGGRGREPSRSDGRVRWAMPRTDASAPLTLPSPPGRRVERIKLESFLGCHLIADGTFEPRFELGEDLLVGWADGGGRGGGRPGPRLEVQHQVEQDLQRARVGGGGFVDELLDHRLALGDLASPAVLGDRHRLVQRVVQQGRQVLRTRRPPARVAGLALLEAGVARRLAVTHFVIALRPGRHLVLSAFTGVWYKGKFCIYQYVNCDCRTKIVFRCYSIDIRLLGLKKSVDRRKDSVDPRRNEFASNPLIR